VGSDGLTGVTPRPTLQSYVPNNVLYAKLQIAQYLQQDYPTVCKGKMYMHSLLDSTILVLCSKPSRNQFARSDPNRFRFCKWNEKSVETKTCFGLSNGIRHKCIRKMQWRHWTEHKTTPPCRRCKLLNVNNRVTENIKIWKFTPSLFASRVFRLLYNSTHNSLQAYVSFRRDIGATQYTSNMAAVGLTVIHRMTSL